MFVVVLLLQQQLSSYHQLVIIASDYAYKTTYLLSRVTYGPINDFSLHTFFQKRKRRFVGLH